MGQARQLLDDHDAAMITEYVPRYQHIVRLGNSEVAGILDEEVVVQEKIDGANMTISLDPGGFLTICSRRKCIFDHGAVIDGFNGAVEYVTKNKGFSALLEEHPDWMLRGDWLVPRTIKYNEDAYRKFYAFDVQTLGGFYVPVGVYAPELEKHGILMAKLLFVGKLDIAGVAALADQTSSLGPNKMEGVVVKRYDYTNKYNRSTWAKLVNAGFSADKSVKMHTIKDRSPQEIRFVAEHVTAALISKVVAAIQVRDGEQVTTKNIAEIVGRCWHDAVDDGIYDFITKGKVQVFDFGSARKLSNDKVRMVVLAYCDGTLDLEKAEDWEALLTPGKSADDPIVEKGSEDEEE